MIRMFWIVVLILTVGAAAHAGVPDWQLYPVPKDLSVTARESLVLGRVAIVIGAQASEPEQYAAERLRTSVAKQYGQDWPVVRENADLKSYTSLIVLGQQSTNKLVGSACRDLKVNASEKFPVQDGFALGVGKSGGKNVAVVAGSNPRSVIYGQDTVLQLITGKADALSLRQVKIRDWPGLKHRGRVCSSPQYFYSTQVLDAVVMARLNFIDVRYGNYGTAPGTKLDKDIIRWVVKEAHKRGLLVYGTASIIAQPADYDKVIATFQEFIDLGVDGLWPYLGDPGGEGRSGTPLDLIARVLDLGKKHGMTGDLIHYTPGKRGYITIATADNFAAAKVPGLDEALWFFAVKPTPASMADAAKLGLKKKYIWWNHWPHPIGGFTSCGNVSMRTDGKNNVYADLTPLHSAYQEPTPEEMALAPELVEGAICWAGAVWLQETVVCPFGWWAWAPKTNDWQQTRRRVYAHIYGSEMLEAAFEFNDTLANLHGKVIRCGDAWEGDGYAWPPMLRNVASRSECHELIEKLRAPLEKLQNGSSKGSMLESETLEKYFFEPMRAELNAAKVVVDLPFPDYWWKGNLSRIRNAVREGNAVQAIRWQAEARQRVEEDVDKLEKTLEGVITAREIRSKWLSLFEQLAGDAARASGSIKLDGVLDEPAWVSAPKLEPFRISNDNVTTPTPSAAQVLYAEDALYVGLTFGEPNMDLLIADNTAHDSPIWEDDAFEIYINSDGLGYPYYRFGANTLAAKYEGICMSGDAIDDSWNGEWDVKVVKGTDRWVAEVRIPYTSIGAKKPEADTLWMCNFSRYDRASERRATESPNFREISAWGYSPRGQMNDTRKFRPVWFR